MTLSRAKSELEPLAAMFDLAFNTKVPPSMVTDYRLEVCCGELGSLVADAYFEIPAGRAALVADACYPKRVAHVETSGAQRYWRPLPPDLEGVAARDSVLALAAHYVAIRAGSGFSVDSAPKTVAFNTPPVEPGDMDAVVA